jgi:hypothetical protein
MARIMNINTDTDVNESVYPDIAALYEITDETQIYEILGDVIVLDRYVNNFDYLFDRVVDTAVLCWNNRNDHGVKLQHLPIRFKVSADDEVTFVLPMNRFMLSLTFIRPILKYIHEVDLNDFILKDSLTVELRGKIQDRIVKLLLSNGTLITDVQETMAAYSMDLKDLLNVFSEADLQMYTAGNVFLDHYKESKLVQEINNTEYPPDMQTSDIIEQNAEKYQKLSVEMTKRKNPFFLANKYTSVLKPKQIEELMINFAQIPDGRELIPVIMNGNGFKAGYHDIDVLYAGAIAARVPDLMNEEYMGLAGYFNRNLMILTYGTLSKTVYDCGSRNTIEVKIEEEDFEQMEGRNYYEYPGSNILKVFHSTDRHLLGKTLYFRSPCKCNLNEDVCHVCYGSVALRVGDLKGGFIYTTEILTKDVGQKVLSAKHILRANAEKIELSESFSQFFTLDQSAVVPIEDKRFDVYIPDDYLDNISDEFVFYVGKEMTKVRIAHYANIYVQEQIIDKAKDVMIDDVAYHKIGAFKIVDICGSLCNITPVNIMLTEKYMQIMRLFESDIATKYTTVEDAVYALNKLMYKTIPLLSVHGEIIISKLLRRPDNKLLRPDFREPNAPYQMLRLKTALQNIESPTTALAFEQTRHHLLHSIFDDRNAIKRVGPRSFVDYFFGEEIL